MEKQSYLADIRFALKQIMGYDRLYVFFQVLLSFMEGLQPLIMIYFPRMIVDAVVEKAEISRIIGIILLMAGIGILYAVLHSAIRFAYMVVKKDMYKNYIMLGISGKIAEMDAELLDDPETHSKCQAAESAASRDLIFGSTERFFRFMSDIVTLLSVIMVIGRLDFVLILLLSAGVLAVFFWGLAVQKFELRQWPVMEEAERRLRYVDALFGKRVHQKELRIYKGIISRLEEKHKLLRREQLEIRHEVDVKNFRLSLGSEMISFLQSFCSYLYIGGSLVKGMITVGQFTQYFQAVSSFMKSAGGILDYFRFLKSNGKYLQVYREFMGIRNQIADGGGVGGEKISEKFKKDFTLELKDVHFRYAGSSKDAVDGMEVSLRKGKFYMVAGENGAGKTTLACLLCRLYDPSGGAILLNGRDIREYDCGEYRKMFSMVFQDFKYYAFSIAENVAVESYDREDAAQREKIQEALRKSGLWEKVSALPKGMDTPLERIFMRVV